MRPGDRTIEILLVEDNPEDADLTKEAFREAKVGAHFTVVGDAYEAERCVAGEDEYAARPRPDLVLLDLKLPGRSGLDVLARIKSDPALWHIPVVVLSTSDSPRDIFESYEGSANCFVTKPYDFNEFVQVVRMIQSFWVGVAQLPPAKIVKSLA